MIASWLDYRTILRDHSPVEPEDRPMNGNELLKRLARRRGVDASYDPARGKGSHGTLYYAERRTTLKDPGKEIAPGLLKGMLDDLGLTKDDLV